MPNTLALQEVQHSQDVTVYVYLITLTGSYVQASRGTNTGELMLPLSATNPSNLPNGYPGIKGFKRGYVIQGGGGNGTEVLPGLDPLHWLLKFYSAANTQLAAGAYNAAITGDLDFLIGFESDPSN
jgi:hypothetical protein